MKKVYKIVIKTEDGKFENISFFRGSPWGAVRKAREYEEAKNKEKKYSWLMYDVVRIK